MLLMIALGLAAWCLLSVVVALAVGRALAHRESQASYPALTAHVSDVARRLAA